MIKIAAIRFSFILCFSTLLNGFCYAQNADVQQLLQEKLVNFKSFQAQFTQIVVDIDKTVLQQANGMLYLQQPNKLRWELFPPNENTLIADGDTLWNLDPFLEQAVAYSQKAQIENNPLILLTDPKSSDWKNYQVTVENKKFVITPVGSANLGIVQLVLMFDNNEQLVSLETKDSQGQVSSLVFTKIKQNVTLAGSHFSFSLPTGWELDDQRAP
ncbi:outer membrane lipoprotein chaperone LolA [Paraglaciecola aquimarina]|uniref:Outer-membrane lipoprotein carrier protein n=1 Tax=Paraglaciecola algarum TaxID=3050085 RepID=A0ABS9D5T7_9ALTE|nr:outer membrane lipoprotein chaperone LolA [Paraglaciecola sp. G1-23]MCF2947036.1 outer membrane lipoprotein chaperone LolA [Paraglaciecola sp. G1-23]